MPWPTGASVESIEQPWGNPEDQQRGHQAGQATRNKCQQVITGDTAYCASTERSQSTAHLVTSKYPGKDHRRVAAAEHLIDQGEG